MHRAYQPLKPTTNKYLQQRWDQTRYEEHVRKVKEALPMVNTRGIQTPAHIQLNLKKRQLQEEKLAIIDRDNHLLSTKLANIMRSTGRVDHRNDYQERSLSSKKRLDELLRVSRQNQVILQRISTCESGYRRQVWEEDWGRLERRRDDISRYPRAAANKQVTKRKVKFESNKREMLSEGSGQVSEATSARETDQSTRSSEASHALHVCK